MLSSPLSFRGRAFLGLAALVLSLFLATALPAEAPRPEQTLTLGQETQEQPIKAGEAHPWRLTVPPGTSVLVTIDQRGIALVAEVRGTGSKNPVFGAGNDRWGPVVLLLDTAGDYKIAVRPRDKGSWLGRYTMSAEAVPSTGMQHEALALMSRAGQAAVPDTPESRKRAVATYRKALAKWDDLGELAWEAEARTCIAMGESRSSNYKMATADLQEALELWQELGKPEREAETWNWLGVVYGYTQGPTKVQEAWERARDLWQGLKEGLEEAQSRNNFCSLDRSLTTALDCYQESAAFFHEHGGAAQEAESLNYIGGIYNAQGEPYDALGSYQKALDLWQPLGDHEKEASVLINIGQVHRTLGEWQEALHFYDLAWEARSDVDDPALAGSVLNNIGSVYLFLGQPQRARDYLEDALKLERQAGDRSKEFAPLNNLGIAWRNLGDGEKALDYHRQAFGVAALLENVQSQAISRLGMAEVHLDRGDPTVVLHDLDEALQTPGEKDTWRVHAQVLQLRGKALTLAGRTSEALPVLQEALSRRRELRDPAGEAETLEALVLAERPLGHDADALAHAEAAVDIVEGLRSALLGVEDLRASFLAARRRSFSLLIDLLMARHAADPAKGYDREAFKISERSHARSLLDVLSAGAAGRASAPPDLLARRSSLLHRLSAKAGQRWKASGDRAKALGTEIDELRSEIDKVEAKIGRSDPSFAALSAPRPVSPQEISDGLEPGTMLLEYSLGEDRSFLWAIEPGRVRSFPLPAQAKIEPLARQVYREMSQAESGSTRPGQAAERLSRLLLGPVWADRAGRNAPPLQRLVVVPDGALDLLPFAALPVPDPGRSWKSPGTLQPLLERVEVVSIPSATTLAVQRQRTKTRSLAPQWAAWAAVFGDPVYTADDPRVARRTVEDRSAPGSARGPRPVVASARRGRRGGIGRAGALSLPRLTATGGEARAIQALAPDGKVKLALGLDANRETVLAGNLRGFRVLHFATHAVADTENPELSGLMLSQVNAEGRPREGFLGLSDIYDLDLDAGLVVLSGCRTALGKEVRGEGLMGLTRGFQYAGVPRVVASLWPVEDRSTAELMKRFYQAMWRRDHPLAPAAALREAQRWLRQSFRDPHSWAGFVLQGDWR